MSHRLILTGVLVVTSLSGAAARGEVRLPAILSEHMVLQREAPIPVWGWAEPGEAVQVMLGDQSAQAQADAAGKWSVALPARAAGGPLELVIRGTNRITLSDVWIGEVWLCSGQSNMAMTVNRARDFEAEQAAADHPRIRQFKVAARYADEPQTDCQGAWAVCSPQAVAGFSATAYFFARELEQKLDVPVGIINASVGGTPIEAWISGETQRAAPELQAYVARLDAERAGFNAEAAATRHAAAMARWREAVRAARAKGEQPPRQPQDPVTALQRRTGLGQLFNGMIAPVLPYGFRGALWYQGEANSAPDRAALYRVQLTLLVTDWRSRHGQGDFPFAWVQLPNFKAAGRNWPLVREAMLAATTDLPQTGLAVTIDVGETEDIHPRNKQEVGRRLSLWALQEVYGQPAPQIPRRWTATPSAGGIEVRFEPPQPLQVDPGDVDLRFAAVAGADGQWHAAQVEVQAGSRLRFSSPEVPAPMQVRYQWANDPPPRCVRTTAGLPLSPFRTDRQEAADPFDR